MPVIPGAPDAPAQPHLRGYAVAVLATVAAAVGRWALDPLLGASGEYLFHYFSVLLTAVLFGKGPALLALVLGTIAGKWLFVALGHVGATALDDVLRLMLYLLFGWVTLYPARRLRESRDESADRLRRLLEQHDELLRREEQVRNIAQFPEENPNPVLRVDEGGRLLYANQACAVITGKDGGTAVGTLAPETIRRAARQALTGGCGQEFDVPGADGRIFSFTCLPIPGRQYVNFYGRDVTETRRALDALRDSERRLRVTFDHAGVGIVEVDGRGRLRAVNDRACEILGYPRSELLGKTVDAVTAPEDMAESDRVYSTLRDGSADRVHYEKRYVRKDGSRVWVHVTVSAVRDESARWLHSIATIEDISERKAAEEEVRRSEAQLQTIVENLDEGLAVSDLDGNLYHWNRAAVEMHGFASVDECRLQLDAFGTIFELSAMDGTVLPLDQWPLARILRGERLRGLEVRIRRLDEDWQRVYSYGGTLVRDDQGQPLMAVVTISDITSRKASEQALKEALAEAEEGRATLDALLDSIPEGIAIVDAEDFRFRRVSRYAGLMLGVDAALLERTTSAEYLSRWETLEPDQVTPLQLVNLPLVRAIVEGVTVEGQELIIRGPDDVLTTILCNAAPIRDRAGRITGGVVGWRDISDRKRIERELEAAKVAAEQAQALAEEASSAKDHFLAVLSHELRTPLTPVLAGLTLLERHATFSAREREYLEVIRRNVELESRLIDDLLDLTRIARGKVELDRRPVELRTILERAVEVCRPDFEARRLQFTVDLHGGSAVVEADAARLQQVFWNLLKNSIKFTPPDGWVHLRSRPENGDVLVEVADNGIGIDPEALGHIFDAFAQGERSITRQFGGLGLGLAISKALVTMHGGRIEAQSEGRGRGALFRVRLPRAAATRTEAGARLGPPAPAAVEPARGLRVLLVEDHGDTAEMMVSILGLEGHIVTTAGDVATALETAAAGEFDMLLSDLGLPDRSGLDLLRELRMRGQTMPAIALSGYGQDADIEQSRQAGFEAHLIKPVDPTRLIETMQRVAGR